MHLFYFLWIHFSTFFILPGLDFDHAQLVVQALANFHATGIAMKNLKPKLFQEMKNNSKGFEIKSTDEFLNLLVMALKEVSQKVPIMAQNYDKCEACILKMMTYWTGAPTEPWSTIVHSDFWVNNFLFQKNSKGKLSNVKFVDFQNYLYSNPLMDLQFLLGISLVHHTTDEEIDFLLRLYHKTLLSKLEKMGCDSSPFSCEKEFQAQLRAVGKIEYAHCFLMTKILTYDPVAKDKMPIEELQSLVTAPGTSKAYYEKLEIVTKRWLQKGWLWTYEQTVIFCEQFLANKRLILIIESNYAML